MDSILDLSEIELNKEKINNSQGSIYNIYSKINKTIPKTPEIPYINITQNYKNTLNHQKRKVYAINLESDLYDQLLTLNKEESQNNYYDIMYKQYLKIISKYEQNISELSNINTKLNYNNERIEELNKN